jgi:hypothetical protein
VKPAPLTRTTQILEVRSAIFNYGVDYVAKHPDVTKDVAVTQATIDDFVNFAAAKDIAPRADIVEALQKPNDRRYIERALKAEIIAAKFGYDASYPYRLQGDTQVEKALEMFPEAQKLAAQASAMQHNGQPGANNAGSRAASNSGAPKTQ